MHTTRALKSAWLFTWESLGAHANISTDTKIVAILNYRRSPQKVRAFVEQLHVALSTSTWDKIDSADKPQNVAYPARFMDVDGIPWSGRIHCGDNPFLFARIVNNLQVIIQDDNREEVTWVEKRDRPFQNAKY